MRRGEVWWAALESPAGRRPVVLISRNESYAVREMVIVAPVTTRVRHIASELPLGPNDGMPKECVVNLDTITTVPKSCLENRLTELSTEKIRDLNNAIRFALGF